MKNLLRSLLTGTLGSSILVLFVLLLLVYLEWISWGIFGAVVSGLVAGVLIGQCTEYYTSDAFKPTQGIASQARLGAATTIIDGIAVGMFSTAFPVIFWWFFKHFRGFVWRWLCSSRNAFYSWDYFSNRRFWPHC